MAQAFVQCGYPRNLVTTSLERAKNQDSLTTTKSEKQVFVIQTYHPEDNPIQDIVFNNWYGLRTHPHLKLFRDHKLIVAHRRLKNLTDSLASSIFVDNTTDSKKGILVGIPNHVATAQF